MASSSPKYVSSCEWRQQSDAILFYSVLFYSVRTAGIGAENPLVIYPLFYNKISKKKSNCQRDTTFKYPVDNCGILEQSFSHTKICEKKTLKTFQSK